MRLNGQDLKNQVVLTVAAIAVAMPLLVINHNSDDNDSCWVQTFGKKLLGSMYSRWHYGCWPAPRGAYMALTYASVKDSVRGSG